MLPILKSLFAKVKDFWGYGPLVYPYGGFYSPAIPVDTAFHPTEGCPTTPLFKTDIWENKINVVTECRFLSAPLKLVIRKEILDKIEALMHHFNNSEWLGYLLGEEDATKYHVNDIVVPKQKASYASVEVTDQNVQEHIIGTVHSHHNFGSFLSGVDEHHLVGNHPITIVVSHNDIKSYIRMKMPCNDFLLREVQIETDYTDYKKEYVDSVLPNFKRNFIEHIFTKQWTK
jgi:proteasome lid subunit RPN8/RPN11